MQIERFIFQKNVNLKNQFMLLKMRMNKESISKISKIDYKIVKYLIVQKIAYQKFKMEKFLYDAKNQLSKKIN